jgi:hypothetical protein
MSETGETRVAILCTHCGRDIDYCSFCDEEDCPAPSCYGCIVVALRESTPALHTHGG